MKAIHGVLMLSALAGIGMFMPSCTYPDNYYGSTDTTGNYSTDYDSTPYYGGYYGTAYGGYGGYYGGVGYRRGYYGGLGYRGYRGYGYRARGYGYGRVGRWR